LIELLASEYRTLLQVYLSWGLILAAFIWGGGPERAVAAVWLICFKFMGWFRDQFFGEGIQVVNVDLYWALSDVLAGLIWVTVALYANRNYTLWIAGLQLLAMSAHIAKALAEAVSPIGYVVMVVAPGWFQLFLLAAGLIRHVQRKRKYGPYRDWRITKRSRRANQSSGGSSLFRSVLGNNAGSWRDELK